MRRLLLAPALLVLLTGCSKYQSRQEAWNACNDWERDEVTFYLQYIPQGGPKVAQLLSSEMTSKECNEDIATRQFIGYEAKQPIKEGQVFKPGAGNRGEWQGKRIVKRFRY